MPAAAASSVPTGDTKATGRPAPGSLRTPLSSQQPAPMPSDSALTSMDDSKDRVSSSAPPPAAAVCLPPGDAAAAASPRPLSSSLCDELWSRQRSAGRGHGHDADHLSTAAWRQHSAGCHVVRQLAGVPAAAGIAEWAASLPATNSLQVCMRARLPRDCSHAHQAPSLHTPEPTAPARPPAHLRHAPAPAPPASHTPLPHRWSPAAPGPAAAWHPQAAAWAPPPPCGAGRWRPRGTAQGAPPRAAPTVP